MMDIYRQTSKHLRIVLTHGILQHMSKDMDENHKTMLGVLLHLRNQEAYNNLNFDRDDERYNRSHDQLYVFNELFGEENPKLSFKASPILKAATDFLCKESFDIEAGYEIHDLTIKYRTEGWQLPLIHSFSIVGIGVNEGKTKTFTLSEH